jgi:hypothetical protein
MDTLLDLLSGISVKMARTNFDDGKEWGFLQRGSADEKHTSLSLRHSD